MTESFAQLFEQSIANQRIRPGMILTGLVVEVGEDMVIVNVGLKSEAVIPLEQFKKLFPEGAYRFRGSTVDGTPVTASATLTHNFPDGPTIVSPAADTRVRPDRVVVEWAPVTTPAGIDIARYQVLVVQEEPVLRVFSADLPATATRLSVPAEFVQPRTEYKVEVLAIETGGNQTLTELNFRTTRAR